MLVLDHRKDISPPADGQLLRYLDITTLIDSLELDVERDYIVFDEQIPPKQLLELLDKKQPKYCALNLSIIHPLHNDYIKYIAKKYKNTFFIFFYNETYYYNTIVNDDLNNFVCISNGIQKYRQVDDDRYFNYYILNTLIQRQYNKFLHYIFKSTLDLKRQKKYLFYNGVHKPHRLKVYDLILKHKLLDDGFYSYLDVANIGTHRKQEFLDFFDVSEQQYDEYIKKFKIPYLCDSTEVTQNIFFPFVNPPQYAFQSYVNITTETTFFDDKDWVSTSEKSFKSFLSFNIPLTFGQRKLNRYLKDLGFDLFDDLFDTSDTHTHDEMYNQIDTNLKVIKDIKPIDLHNFYIENRHRIEKNFITVTTIAKQSIETIRNKCLEF